MKTVLICNGKEEKYCIKCGDEIKYHQMVYGCAVVHDGSECEGSCRCDCDCTPCMHKALEMAKRENRRWREIMASSKQYIRPQEELVKALHIEMGSNGNGNRKHQSRKEKIKVSTTT